MFLFPTATEDQFGTGKFSAGPQGVVLRQDGHWIYGVLSNHLWSVAGEGSRPYVSVTTIQPFLAYTTRSAWSFALTSDAKYNWRNSDWAVPVTGLVGKLFHLGGLPVNIAVGAHYWAASPDNGPQGFGADAKITFVFAK